MRRAGGGAARGRPGLTLLATSRERIGVAGEVTWRVPSLSLADEAVELFADRARLAQADFTITDDNAILVIEICRRLDGMPLAIELAAARVRVLSLAEIVASLHDRFRLLTGGARPAVRRQQTLRASVDWSHALLTEPERILFRRLAVFLGGFDLDAAQAIAGDGDVESYQVLDLLTLLVDKSLVVAESTRGPTRYRLLETVRQYALEKLGESGEADAIRSRHRDHYTSLAALLDAPARTGHEQRIEQAQTEMDNLRAAFGWSLENADIEQALALASTLQPLWRARGRIREGRAWFGAALTDQNALPADVAPAVRARALADKAMLDVWVDGAGSLDEAQRALAIAREVDDPAVLTRALTACGHVAGYSGDAQAGTYFTEAAGLARTLDDRWRLSQILACQAQAAAFAGDLGATRAAAEEGRDLAAAIGDRSGSRECRACLGSAQLWQGDVLGAVAQYGDVVAEAQAAHDIFLIPAGLERPGHCIGIPGSGQRGSRGGRRGLRGGGGSGRVLFWAGLRRDDVRGPCGRRRCGGASRKRGGLAADEFPAPVGSSAAPHQRRGRAGGLRSHRCPAVGR